MNTFTPNLTPLVIAFVVLDLVAVLTIVGVGVAAGTTFFRRHRRIRTTRHLAFGPYYRGLALHH